MSSVLTNRGNLDAERHIEARWPWTSHGEWPGTEPPSQPLEGILASRTVKGYISVVSTTQRAALGNSHSNVVAPALHPRSRQRRAKGKHVLYL